MSLLMKALEKAAKDRVDARAELAVAATPAAASAAAPAPGRSELSLEPLAAGSVAPNPAAPAPGLTPAPSRTPAAAPAPAAAAPASVQAQSQAAIVLQATAASSRAPNRVVDYARAHPVVVLGSLAGLFAAAFAIYVYLQIAHPGVFTGRPPVAPSKGPVQPFVQAPVAPIAAPAAPAAPLPAAPLLREAATASAAAAARKPEPRAPEEEAASRNTVVVSRGSVEPVLSPRLFQAYTALQARQFDLARLYYSEIIATEPRNIDALLGLAAIAAQIGDSEEATRRYLQILELEPRHALAQNGLIGLLGRADPLAAASKLRHLISLEPAPYLYFTLGNLHADQSQWAAAQQAYFQAHHLEPANSDYAYNLAVALEHLGQPKLALGFYRRAVQMATAGGRANFIVSQAQERIGKLAAQVE